MGKPEKADLVCTGTKVRQYYQLLRRAVADGRLDGKYPCKLCGMKYPTRNSRQTSVARFQSSENRVSFDA